MHNMAPLTKILFICLISVWAMLLNSPLALAGLAVCQLLLFPLSGVPAKSYQALGGLAFFAVLLAVMQYAFGAGIEFSALVALRMAVMTSSFILLFATTRIQDLTAALVRQFRVPHEYAFMVTATLRFIPDFFAEIKAVKEAQACRGYCPKGNLKKRLINYLTIVQPLVLRAITRSETMAISLELRGFGAGATGGYGAKIAVRPRDYLAMAVMALGTAGIVFSRFS